MIIGGRARTTITEIDLSERVPGFPGVYGAMALDTKKGEYTPYLVTSDSDFLRRYTLYEKIQVGESTSLFEACFFLEKNNKLWISRTENNNALYGACLIKQDKPYNEVGVTFNSSLGTVNLKHVTALEIEVANIVWKSVRLGEVCTFIVSEGASLPDGILADTKYYLIPNSNDDYSFLLASSYNNAFNGISIEFTGEFDGDIKLSFGLDIRNEETSGVKDVYQYQLNTSDGQPAGTNSDFTVDMDNDQITVSQKFYNSCVTGDELTITGSELPTVATGLPITSDSSVFCIKVPQEGVNIDKFKVQIARSSQDALTGKFINFVSTGKSFSLTFVSKDDSYAVEKDNLNITEDTITCSTSFHSLCQLNAAVKLSQVEEKPLPVVSGDPLDTDTIYYVIVGSDNKIQLSREKNGAAINFTTDMNEGDKFKVTFVDKAKSSMCSMDLSNDTLLVSETFYEMVSTGYTCTVSSTGTLPSGLKTGTTYYVIKTDTKNLIKLASTKDNALLGVPVDILDSGVFDVELGESHIITDTHNNVLTGYSENCLIISTKTATPEDIYVQLVHYPYGTEENWTEEDKVLARTLQEPFTFYLSVYKKWEDNSYTLVEKWLMSRKQDAMDGSQTNIYCEEVAKRSSYINVVNNTTISDEIYPRNQSTMLKLAGGSEGDTATTGDMILAIEKLANRRRYNCTLIMDAGYAVPAYQQAIISLCESRQYTVGILSVPTSAELSANYLQDILDYRNNQLNSNTSYAALYSPHLKVYDKYNNREIYVSPTGHVGANISETGENQELWYPVAGNTRGVLNVLGLSRVFEDADEDELYNNQINPIDFNSTKGIRIWGNKTLLRKTTALDRLNVRLLLTVIEPAIQEFLDDFLFEINDAFTRSLIVSGLSSYMESIKSRRGVYDYSIVCDESNNTAEDIDNYLLNAYIYIQPTKSIEYIMGKIIITRTNSDFTLEV